jgi:hypothetical protein
MSSGTERNKEKKGSKEEGPRQTGAKQNRKPPGSVYFADIDITIANPSCFTRPIILFDLCL